MPRNTNAPTIEPPDPPSPPTTTDERALQAMERQALALERIADALAGAQATLDRKPAPDVG